MDDRNRELLTEVIKDRIETALDLTVGEEARNNAFKEAMQAVDKQIELDKVDTSYQEHFEKLEKERDDSIREEEFKREESKKNRRVQILTFTAGLLITPTIDILSKLLYADRICKLEQFETFTSSAGRGISSWFKFKN